MTKDVDWSKYYDPKYIRAEEVKEIFGFNKVLAMNVMLARGPIGFRKLDYEFAEKKLNVKEIMDRLEENHFNVIAITCKDTDGACLWNTSIGWNPTNRDLLGEFSDEAKSRNMLLALSFTSMNDAYQGHIHPERASIHGKNGKWRGTEYKIGDVSTHDEGEMRIDLPEGVTLEEYQKKIPFLTNRRDEIVGKKRGNRGQGYIPTTTFMCPTSEHVDYLIDLAEEIVKNYKVDIFIADYIRYDGSFTDLCACERCQKLFREKYGNKPKLLKSTEWYDFKEDNIANYAQRLHNKIKSIDEKCISGASILTGPKLFTRKRIAQNWTKLSTILDVLNPQEYPYLLGTHDDGWKWGKLGDLAYWYFTRNMKKRIHEFKSPILAVSNSVECNSEEMLKQIRRFDFGLGIALFKYFGTTDQQWAALKKYAEEELGLDNLSLKR